MADFDNKERKPKGAMDPALDKTAATSKRPASTIKTADAAETLQDAATRVKDVVQDASARGAQSAGEAATRTYEAASELAKRGYEAASEIAERGYERGRELVSRGPSLSDTIASFPITSVAVAALVGGYIAWTFRGGQER